MLMMLFAMCGVAVGMLVGFVVHGEFVFVAKGMCQSPFVWLLLLLMRIWPFLNMRRLYLVRSAMQSLPHS